MKSSRRIKRMARNRPAVARMSLTSLMDVFTILVFFLLVNSVHTEVVEAPERITLPASVVEDKPRETVVIYVSPEEVIVQGEIVAQVGQRVIGRSTRTVGESREVTILADKTVPFIVVKRVMSTCTSRGYERISLAVLQKAPETQTASG